jgi:hypothetical protein
VFASPRRPHQYFVSHKERPRNLSLDFIDKNGAQGRNRTTDTAIFSRMLYQLSYLGTILKPEDGLGERRFIVRRARSVHHASLCSFAYRSHAIGRRNGMSGIARRATAGNRPTRN